ncbi:hypothetical protein [Azoarcus sp. DD4]|nr:hypothetical protein [Azoarcus sp. DD4]
MNPACLIYTYRPEAKVRKEEAEMAKLNEDARQLFDMLCAICADFAATV